MKVQDYAQSIAAYYCVGFAIFTWLGLSVLVGVISLIERCKKKDNKEEI